MSGVWVFNRNGVVRLIEKPTKKLLEEAAANGGGGAAPALPGKKSVLVHVPTGQVVRSHEELASLLRELGWERYYAGSPDLIRYHRSPASPDLISLPKRFSDIRSMHMYDIAVKNRSAFLVWDRQLPRG